MSDYETVETMESQARTGTGTGRGGRKGAWSKSQLGSQRQRQRPRSPRVRTFDDYMSGYETLSDTEETVPLTANLPNAAPAKFVYLGFLFAILAGICFTCSNVSVKYIPEVNSWQLLFIRCLLQMLVMLPIIYFSPSKLFGPPDFSTRWRIAAQGILGGILLLAIFMAVQRLPLGDCTAIFFSSPAFTMVLSYFILKDHCGFLRAFVATCLLTGVLVLSHPPSIFSRSMPSNTTTGANITISTDPQTDSAHSSVSGQYDVFGILCALSVPMFSAIIVIITRQAKHVHFSVLVFWFGAGGLVTSTIGIFCTENSPEFKGWDTIEVVLSVTVALLGIIGSMLMTQAVYWVTPSKIMVVRSFEVVAAYILQVTLFDVPAQLTDVFGALLVISAVLGIAFEDIMMDGLRWRFL